MPEWDEIARQAWASPGSAEERIAGWLLDFDARLRETAADQPPEDRASIESFVKAANKPPRSLMETTPALYVLASRALWYLRGMDDDLERIRLLGAALSMAYTAGQGSGGTRQGNT